MLCGEKRGVAGRPPNTTNLPARRHLPATYLRRDRTTNSNSSARMKFSSGLACLLTRMTCLGFNHQHLTHRGLVFTQSSPTKQLSKEPSQSPTPSPTDEPSKAPSASPTEVSEHSFHYLLRCCANTKQKNTHHISYLLRIDGVEPNKRA